MTVLEKTDDAAEAQSRRRSRASVALACVALLGCSTLSADTGAEESGDPNTVNVEDVNDPFETVNRAFFAINLAIDKAVLRPLAMGYDAVMPEFAQDGIRNVLDNLDAPVVLANDLLQGEMSRASTTLGRFAINSTLGLGGLFDVAEEMGLPQHSEDFGQTLAVWGVGEGPYLVVPLLGPAPPRDLAGRFVDMTFDPFNYVNYGRDLRWVPLLRSTVSLIDSRARLLTALDEIERTSIDHYVAIRSIYRQARESAISNGESDVEDLPDFPSDEPGLTPVLEELTRTTN